MLRSLISLSTRTGPRAVSLLSKKNPIAVTGVRMSSGGVDAAMYGKTSQMLLKEIESGEANGYDVREMLNTWQGEDFLPGTEEILNLMVACRKLNDYALAVRVLEAVQWKYGEDLKTYQELIDSIQPKLDEIGILNVRQMGYDQPEFFFLPSEDYHSLSATEGELVMARHPPRKLPVYDGMEMFIPCDIVGRATTIEWFVDDKLITPGEKYAIRQTGTLDILDVGPEDIGTWKCKASNSQSSCESTTCTLYYWKWFGSLKKK